MKKLKTHYGKKANQQHRKEITLTTNRFR